MIGLDTNVLVRYIMQDDPKQSPKANKLVESLDGENPGFITLISVVELYGVLTSSFDLSGEQAAQALGAIIQTKQLLVEQADQVLQALRMFGEGKADFPDCLIQRLAANAGCTQTMTFDAGVAKHGGMTLIH
ncbi:MAG: PIN domain-containing protein [Candidimonas sp.]|nr:MAG: PIN domain-containing protein [Candidimonas sp.]TAM26922.1 MAG: PIN domain-containing protein [Candidimonas sp.]